MTKLTNVLALFVFALLISGCSVIPLGLSDSSTPLNNSDGTHRQYEVLGKAEGTQGYFTLFSLIPFGSPDFSVAINDAVKKFDGDALINVRYWYRVSDYLIGTYSSIEVEGDVIKFNQKKENQK
ncbi:MAG: hypothetical protein P4L27_05530 [Ignavibacteriaceae bacterium]|nr:hypothetical protein [Ignavibacteriaceae bacterium]